MRPWLRWLITALPLAVSLAIIRSVPERRVLLTLISLRADFHWIIVGVGFTLSLVIGATFIVIAARDRIRQRSVIQARKEAFAEHHRFLHRLDHELKNPLTAIRAGLANLSEMAADDQQRIIDTMEAQTQRLIRLVSDLRKVAELETVPLEFSRIDLPELLEESVALVQDRPELDDRKLIVLPSASPLPLRPFTGDPDLLLLAIHNLLDNALKFTRPGDTIRLCGSAEEDGLVIEVSDSGIGIPSSEIGLVWEELYRGHGLEQIAGNGIGLALVQVIVERHGGKVRLESDLAQGTRVRVLLPAT
jgi:two-component system OmpR family sensor kinase